MWFPTHSAKDAEWMGHPVFLSTQEFPNSVKYLTEFRNGEIAQRMARESH